MGVAEDAIPIAVKNIRLMFFTGSWRKLGVQFVPLLTDAKADVLAITAWTMTATPQRCGIVHKASAEAASASQSARFP